MTEPNTIPADPLVAKLRSEAVASVAGGAGLLIGGLALAMCVAVVLALLLWIVVGLPGMGLVGWAMLLFVIYLAAAVGWAIKRPPLQSNAAFTYVDPRAEWAGPGAYGGSTSAVGMVADYAFVPGRMVISGIDQAMDKEPATRERFFDRCALLLRQLGRAGEAVPIAAVQIGADETIEKLSPVLNYLNRADWIGTSSDQTRVWLSGRAKDQLMRIGLWSPPE